MDPNQAPPAPEIPTTITKLKNQMNLDYHQEDVKA